jgi:hypothetical protein
MGLALIHQNLGEYKAALILHEQVLDTQVRCLGTGHVSVAMTYGNMGCVYEQLGMLENALEMHEKDLEIKLKTVGSLHAGWAEAQGRRGRGAQKSCAPGGGAGRSKKVGGALLRK